MNILSGINGLLQSRKATLSLLILVCSTVALFMGKLDGPSYAGVIGTVAVIYNFCQHRVDVATVNLGLPTKGSP